MIDPCYGTKELKRVLNCNNDTLIKIFNIGGLKRKYLYPGSKKYVVGHETLTKWLRENEVSTSPDFNP